VVRWVPDATRPHFEPGEIDRECEALVAAFLAKHRGKVDYTLTTDELTVLIEQHVDVLDLYANLSTDGPDVEGAARLAAGQKPVVEISAFLSTDDQRANRLRTTLAHELGHVRLHDPLFQVRAASGDLFQPSREMRVVCKRDGIIGAPQVDWMEWQAGYASGSYLMPRSALATLLRPTLDQAERPPPFHVDDEQSRAIVWLIIEKFGVSRQAACVRLSQLGYVTTAQPTLTLFG
jgi:Zn-dependent peptidase ImmA (M78 family)